MRREQRSFTELLARSLAASGFIYAMALAYVLPASLLTSAQTQPLRLGPAPGTPRSVTQTWMPAHSNRFPGCVDVARWSDSKVPRTVVVVRRDGDLARLQFDEAFRRAMSPSAADDVRTIGACG